MELTDDTSYLFIQGFFTKNKGISYELSYVIFISKNLIACTFDTLIYIIQPQN